MRFCKHFLIVLLLTNISPITWKANAQNYRFTIENEVQISDRILDFELYLLNINSSRPFELSGVQAGILVNPAIYNGGTLTVEIQDNSSELSSFQTPTSVIWSADQNAIKLTPKMPPGAGNGTIIGTSAPGTRVCRLRIINTAPFANATADLSFSFTTVPYPTKVAEYISGVNTQLISDNTYCYSNAENFILNDNAGPPGPSEIIVTANAGQSKTYGQPDPLLTYTWNPSLTGTDKFTGSPDREPGEDAGTYTIGPGSLTAGPGYTITFVPAEFVINKAILQVSADNKVRFYSEPNPELTITCSGFMNNDNKNDLDILPDLSTLAVNDSEPGIYEIIVSGGSDNNYEYHYVDGILSVKKSDQEIFFSGIPAGLRVTESHLLTATASSGLPVTYESSDTTRARIAGNKLTIFADGSVTIKAKQEGNNFFNAAPDVSQVVMFLPAFGNVSSIFTPNGDGMNDYWLIPDIDQYGTVKAKIYNRFGRLVYESGAYKNDWDGTFNGNPLPAATYYFILETSAKGIVKGAVNIVR